ncbi:magnesium transporter, partial [Acinetobacter bohemicus]|uniref:magnesium transporter MgtE N-terminal domain-containing protein n=2 Tax=Acinetobacter TaxID=469 RepID=UPI003978A298|nr:magnesium transporter [Acinetobacter bohemicus]
HLPARAYVFSYLKPEEQVKFAHGLTRTDLAEIMGEMPSDKRVDLFKCLDHEQQNTLLPALAQAEREDIRQLSSYVEGTAGA